MTRSAKVAKDIVTRKAINYESPEMFYDDNEMEDQNREIQ